jgi:aldehyde dehydrogenase (NAD+)
MNRPDFLSDPTRAMLIDGIWVAAASGAVLESRNPANGDLLATIPDADAADVDAAVRTARRAFEGGWSSALPAERHALLLRLADLIEANGDELAMLDTLDMGMPLWRTRGSIALMAGILRYNAGLALSIHGKTLTPSKAGMAVSTLKEPLGVCAAIIPWNSPAWSATLNVAPALAAGCTIVLKPAEDASLAPLLIGRLCLDAGIPAGVVNVVTGRGATAGAALAEHPDVDKIAFTGSTLTGQSVMRAAAGNLKKVSLELGGKSPNIVFADADLEAAARVAVMAAFGNSGQVCSAGSRLFVERPIADAFAAEVARLSAELRLGDGCDPETKLGPLVSQRQLDRVLGYIETARAAGANIIAGGERLSGAEWDKGFFVPPTIVADATDDMVIVREEIFGPVLSILAFDEEAEVVERANATPYGLGAAVWTRDIGRAHRVGRALRAGSVWVNCYNELDPTVPSGGYKASGIGREYGEDHLEEFLQTKALWINAG